MRQLLLDDLKLGCDDLTNLIQGLITNSGDAY